MKNVELAIAKNIHNQKAIFVFPTDVSATSWAEFALEIDGVEAISSERFTAWDKFKAHSIRSQKQDKNSIPSVLRKFFAEEILERNKTEQLFSTIINREYLQTSSSFSDWIAGILPQLQVWEENLKTQKFLDAEDKDFLVLKKEYTQFLETHNFFDPAWERPPFNNDGFTYFICYPEILTDYAEYKEILENTDCIEIIHIDDVTEKQQVLQYTNTRSELRETALYIREIVEKKSIQYNEIALSVKDLATLEPYITREFKLYNIPFKIRSGKALTDYPAGKLFTLISDCYNEKFSFESVKNLVLDTTFPWTDTETANQLVKFGIKNNCLCSYDNKDLWEEAFKKTGYEERAKNFYGNLKIKITNIVEATNFDFILKHYMSFKKQFFNFEEFTEQSNSILSRCIVELVSLTDLEKDYPAATKTRSPFTFFVDQLQASQYVPQNSDNGVHIFTYKNAACALYKQHIIFDSSQDALTITEKRLSFLRDDKRNNLGIIDENTSKSFVDLYTLHSEYPTRFTCSEKTFGGYAIPFNYFETIDLIKNPEISPQYTSEDLFKQEKNLFIGNNQFLGKMHSIQKMSFDQWKIPNKSATKNLELADTIRKKIFNGSEKLVISATTLNEFYNCPVHWIFDRLLHIEDSTLEANLLDNMAIGTLFHVIINKYLNHVKKNKRVLCLTDDELPTDLHDFLVATAKEVIEGFPASINKKDVSELTMEMFSMQKNNYIDTIIAFITYFSSVFTGSTVIETEKSFRIEYSDHIVTGQVDCVLDYPGSNLMDAGMFIVDFKLHGLTPRSKCIKTEDNQLENFQLPFYIYLCENEWFKNKPEIQGATLASIADCTVEPILGTLLSNNSKKPYYGKDQLTRTGENAKGCSFEPTMEALYEAIENFKNAILEKELSIFTDKTKWGTLPNEKKVPFAQCRGCDYRKYCRTTYSISGAQ